MPLKSRTLTILANREDIGPGGPHVTAEEINELAATVKAT